MASVRIGVACLILGGVALASTASAVRAHVQRKPAVPIAHAAVINVYPHDPDAYTQGLIYRNGFLFESTGLHGQSTLRQVKLETGEVLRQRRLDRQYFAEGLAEWNGT